MVHETLRHVSYLKRLKFREANGYIRGNRLIESYKHEPFTDCNAINFFNNKSASDELIVDWFTSFDRSEEREYHCLLETGLTCKIGFEMAMQEHGDEAEDVTLSGWNECRP